MYLKAAATTQSFLQHRLYLLMKTEFWSFAGKHNLLTEHCHHLHGLLIHKKRLSSGAGHETFTNQPEQHDSELSIFRHWLFTPYATATSQAREQTHTWHGTITRFIPLFKTHYFPDSENKWIVMVLAYVSEMSLNCSCRCISLPTEPNKNTLKPSCPCFRAIFTLLQGTMILHTLKRATKR